MIIEFVETDYETALTFFPETADEVAQLYRMVNNSKAQKPYLFLQFNDSGRRIYGHVSMKKIKMKSASYKTSISNYKP